MSDIEITPTPAPEKPRRKPRSTMLAKPKPPAEVKSGLAEKMARPSLAFFSDINARLLDSARAEKARIEETWAQLRERWIELDTLEASINAANAVAGGQPASSLSPDFEHPGGPEGLTDLQRQLQQEVVRLNGNHGGQQQEPAQE